MLNFIRNLCGVACFTLLIFVCGGQVFAQQITGSVTGSVLDPSGAAVSGATLRLNNLATGNALRATTDQAGNFQFLLLQPGNYNMDVSMTGFKTFRRDAIVVEADRSVPISVSLTMGEVSETVEVAGGAVLLESNTSEVGTVMDQHKLEELPLNGRNPMGLANLIPTVKGLGTFGGQILESWRSGAVNIGGGQSVSNGFLLDGMPNDKIGDAAGATTFLTVDATQEFKVVTNAMSAEFGRSAGGVISVISKSGTNEYHGDVFEYLRNTLLKANDFFANKSGAPRQVLHINQFGGAVGGPIKKDKLFFFYNYEGYKERRFFARLNTAPTALQRAGDFSQTYAANGQLITVYDPTTTVANPNGPGFIRQPLQNNLVPQARQSKIAQSVFALYPQANITGSPVTGINNLFQSGTQPTDRYNTGIRSDYILSPERRLAVRYTRDVVSWIFPNFYGSVLENDGRFISVPRHSASLQFTDSFSPTLLADFKLGFNRDGEHGWGPFSQAVGSNTDLVAMGFPAAFVSQLQRGRYTPRGEFPRFSVTDLVSAAGVTNLMGGSADQKRGANDWSGGATITKILGAHTVKMGYQYAFYTLNCCGVTAPSFTFDRGFTQGPDPTKSSVNSGFGMASFLLGTPSAGSAVYNADYTLGQHYHAIYVQDDWKVTRRLTLNLGMRWEYEGAITDRYNVFTNFDPTMPSPLKVPGLNLLGGAFFPGATGGSRGYHDTSWRHFGPRVGYAYQVTTKLVARGGYGISYIPTKGTPLPAFTGFRTTTPMVNTIDGGLTPYNTMANPFPTGLNLPTGTSLGALTAVGSDMSMILRNVRPGYAQQWNFTLQYQPWDNWLIEAAYLGSRGVHLLTAQSVNLDQINPQYLALGNQLLQSVPNPFFGIIPTGPLAASTITRQQLLLPFPQYTSDISLWGFLGNSTYNAFTLKVEKRFSKGFSLLLAYTDSKLIDAAAGSGGAVRTGSDANSPVLNWYNLAAERSRSIEDIPQRVVLTGLWELPFFKQSHGVERWVLAGWHLNTITTLQAGPSIALIAGATNRPNVVGGVDPTLSDPTLAKWFNTAAYTTPAPFTYGNSSRTMPNVTGPGLQTIDFSVFKDFTFRERYKLQFRGEAFNLFNKPAFDVPGRDVTQQTFGVVTATLVTAQTANAGSRELQFSLRLSF